MLSTDNLLVNSPPRWLEAALAEAYQEAKQIATRRGAFLAFQQRYRYDPAKFVLDCIEHESNRGPTSYQLDILKALATEKRVAVRGPHGIGKTALAAWVALWAILTSDDCKVPMTASAFRQLSKFLFPEVHKWARRLRWGVIGREPFSNRDELLTLAIKRTGFDCEAFAVASDNPDLIEGAHAQRIVYIYDESKSVRDETFDASEGAFSTAGPDTGDEAYALAISTPGEPQGRFYEIHARRTGLEDWWVRHVTKEEAIAAGRMSKEWSEQRARQWGKGSAVYQNRVLGEFASSDTDGVIPLAWIELAVERWHQWKESDEPNEFTGVGVDIGGGGSSSDATVFAFCYNGVKIDTLRKYPRGNPNTATMETAGRIKGILDSKGGIASIDVIGIGIGVVHRLREQGLRSSALAFNAAEGTKHRDMTRELGFANKRSAGWWIVREMLDPANDHQVALPPDDELTGDLTAPKYRVVSGGRVQVESKKDIRKRLKRSTDCGDAVMQILARQLVKRGVFFG